MFLIIGVTPKIMPLGSGNGVCPACGKAVEFHTIKQCSVFTFFFIPIFSFGTSYLAKCPKCDSVMALSKERGKDLEHGSNSVIYNSDLKIIQNNVGSACSVCGAKIIANQNYCYHCGTKM